jgi:serine/threonine-protein kinase HipA
VIAEGVSLIDQGLPVPRALADILKYAVAVGGARPKALVRRKGEHFIAKFPSWSDERDILRAEVFGNYLSHYTNGCTAWTEVEHRREGNVMFVRRFDRDRATGARRHLVSGLTLLGLSENLARYASYEDLARVLAQKALRPNFDVPKFYDRMLYNIVSGNTDDHARNHAFFWDGEHIALAPAYDLEPRPRFAHEANQAMAICGDRRESRIALALEAAASFGLDYAQAVRAVCFLIDGIEAHFIFANMEISEIGGPGTEFVGNPLLHPYCMEGAPKDILDGLEFELITRKYAVA